MKMLVVVALALVAAAAAAPAGTSEPPKILRALFEQQPEGGFLSSFETENGIKTEVTGELKTVLDEDKKEVTVVVQRGSYSYSDAEGKPITIVYVADENGFQPQGDSIPKSPAAVARR